jgi:polyisoprenoid-binding protein YceI
MRLAVVALLTALAAPAAFAADEYTMDPSHSQIRFGWNHFGFSNIEAQFAKFESKLVLDPQDWSKSSVDVTIPVDSVDSGVAKLDEHLKGADFFDAAKFPTITFKSTKVEQAGDGALKVSGDLTIHGVTKPAVLDVTINKVGTHPMAGGEAAGFDAKTTIKRSDFGVGKYAPNVSDEIRIAITTETHKAKAPDAAK